MISQNIKKYRKDKDLTLSKLAQMAGVSKSYLHQLENGKSKSPSVNKLSDIAGALGVSVNDLTDRELVDKSQESKQPLPPSLEKALEKYPEMKEYKNMLAGLKMRGKYPEKPEDWYALYTMVKNTIRP